MKGLGSYIQKHGKHFTLKLAHKAVLVKWNAAQVEESINKEAWYNVTESTLGDIVYWTNLAKCEPKQLPASRKRCIKYALSCVGDVRCNAFTSWIALLKAEGKDFNFTPYI